MEMTPEGKIVSALLEGPKRYRELRAATGLSDRWLSKKLKELSAARILGQAGDCYHLENPEDVVEADPLFLPILRRQASREAKARLMAKQIASDRRVIAVILFGSVAKGRATAQSDIDLLIVTEQDAEEELSELVFSLMFKYDVPVEAIFITLDDLIANLQNRTAFSFGLLEGYKILYDRLGLAGLLSFRRKELLDHWFYDEEAGSWIRRRPKPT